MNPMLLATIAGVLLGLVIAVTCAFGLWIGWACSIADVGAEACEGTES